MGFGFSVRGSLGSPIWASSVCWYEVYFVQDCASCFDFCRVSWRLSCFVCAPLLYPAHCVPTCPRALSYLKFWFSPLLCLLGGAEELARLRVPPSCIYIDHIQGVCLCEQLFTCHANPAKDKALASPLDCGCYLPGIHQWRPTVWVCIQPRAWRPHGLFLRGCLWVIPALWPAGHHLALLFSVIFWMRQPLWWLPLSPLNNTLARWAVTLVR